MSPRQRVLTILLIEKIKKNPQLAKQLGIQINTKGGIKDEVFMDDSYHSVHNLANRPDARCSD